MSEVHERILALLDELKDISGPRQFAVTLMALDIANVATKEGEYIANKRRSLSATSKKTELALKRYEFFWGALQMLDNSPKANKEYCIWAVSKVRPLLKDMGYTGAMPSWATLFRTIEHYNSQANSDAQS